MKQQEGLCNELMMIKEFAYLGDRVKDDRLRMWGCCGRDIIF